MHLALLGLSHHNAPIEVLERLHSTEHAAPAVLNALSECPEIHEAVLLSTCNRTELYLASETGGPAVFDAVSRSLARVHSISIPEFTPYLYQKSEQDAVNHLMRVASGLDSLVLGEAQILGQVRTALHIAGEAGTTEAMLTKLFEKALATGKRVQSETGLGRGAFSIGKVAVDLASRIFDDFSRARVLILGAGKMSEQAAQHLVRHGVRFVVVANRTYERAAAMAERLGGRAVHFDDALRTELVSADIVISATNAPHPILRRDMVASVIRQRRGRTLFLIDIALPRDIEPDVSDLSDVILYNIFDLQNHVQEHAEVRAGERARAESVVNEEVANFMTWYRSREVAPVIDAFRSHLDRIRQEYLDIFVKRLSPSASAKDRKIMEDMAQAMMNQVARTPILRLKQATNEDAEEHDNVQVDELLTAMTALFGLETADSRSMASTSIDSTSKMAQPIAESQLTTSQAPLNVDIRQQDVNPLPRIRTEVPQ